MIKRLLSIYLFLLIGFSNNAQTYGNEWINYSQKYYSIKIVNTGIHRLNYADLLNASIPVDVISHENLQLFGREKEVPLWIETNGDSSFDPGDYILFYADKNDGWIDSLLYIEADKIGNPKYSLFNDTIRYFISWNNLTTNLRFNLESDLNYSAYTPANYVWDDYFQSYNEAYHEGEKIDQISSSFYINGEGYGRTQQNGASTGYNANFTAGTQNPYTATGSPQSKFEGLVITKSNANQSQGIPNHHTRWTINGQQIDDQITQGYKLVKTNVNFPSSILTSGTPVTWSIVGDLPVLTDFQALNYWSIEYPRIPNFNGLSAFDVKIENSAATKIRLDISNLSYSQPILLSLGVTPHRLTLENNSGNYQTLIPNDPSGNQRLVYGDLANAITISTIEPVSATGYFTNYATLNYESSLLMIYHKSMTASSQEYRDYRLSEGYNALLIDVEQLYLQFAGGVDKHIIGIRRFANFAFNNATNKPVGLFLMGKGVSNSLTRSSAVNSQANLIPTWGVPASDVFITSNLTGTTMWSPLIPTGRISVNTDEGLRNYLDKIQEYDNHQNQTDVYNYNTKDWQKHAIHLVGGSDANQQNSFQAHMNMMRDTFESKIFAGNVLDVHRNSADPIDPSSLAEITQRLEDGVSLLTYFGHFGIGTNGFEINIDDVDNWNNAGKYPVMLVNSCYNGDIFKTSISSSSEYFVNAENVGAIAYVGSVSTGFDIPLADYSKRMYREFGHLSYGQSLGQNMKNTIDYIQSLNYFTDSLYWESTCAQMVLNGDPMLKLNHHDKPEIDLLEHNISFYPEEIDLNTDSIEMKIALNNLGRSVIDTFIIEVRRNFPGSDVDSVYFKKRAFLHYTDTIYFKFPLQPNISVGINTFNVKVDIPNFINEQYDEIYNNQIVKTYFLNIDGILPVTPYEFAVVPYDTITVKASTINPIAEFNTYRFQLDTTDLFNSPFLRNATVSGLGGVKEVRPNQWDTPLLLEDSVVYFWRVAIDEAIPNWSERSFQYIPGKSGWGQDHFFQFKKNNFFNIIYNKPDRLREWAPDSTYLNVNIATYAGFDNSWYLDGTLQEYDVCGIPTLCVAVIDPITFEAWRSNYAGANPQHDYGNFMQCANSRGRPEGYFEFRQYVGSDLTSFQNMVLNEVPDGYHMVIYSPGYTSYPDWNALDSANMYQTFATLGSTEIIAGLSNTDPFIFYVRKGYPSSAEETFIDVSAGESTASFNTYLYSAEVIGQETSTLIGPSFRWGNVYWKQDSIDPVNNADTTRLAIMVYTPEKVFAYETNVLFTANDSILNLNSIVDANLYPYIRLKAYYKDTVNFTPAQIDRWHVLYDHVPEAAIDGSNQYLWSLNGESISEGQEISFAVDVKNIYDVHMDSLLITYWVEDANHIKHFISYPRQDSLKIGQTLRDTVTFSTLGFGGLNSFWMEVNPYVNGSVIVTDQREQEHFNNILQVPFFVIEDDENPILDVTFDGRHILNGDIVNPNSEIYITLKDDNEFLVMDDISDTTLFGVYITSPSGVQKRIPFIDATGNTVMQWIPAQTSNKRFKIIYPAGFEQNGTYKLLVQGSDRSGNLSGDLQYSVSFDVIHESTITQMMNYPNPFSTSTRFVFTLTGSEVPDDIIIQIMTVSGRVVREITEDQLGRIYIGRNISEYAWDGTDEFGDPLANGVYLYNVRAKIGGENIEHRESGADQYFKKNFGKMYLMR